ncbi:HD-GYP domain-containing protein [Noviherbaspirillum pedocola]|uniref:HD domain-containing protein n=1 Tax=Noviherbaspirillum pedocola TaxID=2801341 RepID=A0A934T2C6_9BURK|nr:HD domain-containing phosphohydrolase [Noviherbaspirillum pedocola]MBK4737774.1 HD domain-containing protein [Noviherbaspirillum pedocola]
MKSERGALYRHSLYLVLLSRAIGARLSLSASEMRNLMLAALSQDLGEMHTDPELLKSGRMLQGPERNVIHVHPVTSHAILSRIPAVPEDALQAVLQHHERLDGSGYPGGTSGAGIDRLARILAVAETAEVMLRRFDPERFSVAFRLHRARLDADCIRAVYELLPPANPPNDDAPQSRGLSCGRVAAVFAGWPDLLQRVDSSAAHEPLAFVTSRIYQVQSLARQAGYSAEFLDMINLDGDDAYLAAELLAVQEEIIRMLDDMAFEFE